MLDECQEGQATQADWRTGQNKQDQEMGQKAGGLQRLHHCPLQHGPPHGHGKAEVSPKATVSTWSLERSRRKRPRAWRAGLLDSFPISQAA